MSKGIDIKNRQSVDNYGDDVLEVTLSQSSDAATMPRDVTKIHDETTGLLEISDSASKGSGVLGDSPRRSSEPTNLQSGKGTEITGSELVPRYPKDLHPSSSLFQAIREISKSQLALDRESSDVSAERSVRVSPSSSTNTSFSSLDQNSQSLIVKEQMEEPAPTISITASSPVGSHIPFRFPTLESRQENGKFPELVTRKKKPLLANYETDYKTSPETLPKSGHDSPYDSLIGSFVTCDNHMRAISMPRLNEPEVLTE